MCHRFGHKYAILAEYHVICVIFNDYNNQIRPKYAK